MALVTKAIKGTQDILPSEVYKNQFIEQTAIDIAGKFGFKEIRTPVFEHTELFQRGVGETSDVVQKEMYTFDDKGGRSITLRPEGTAGVARAFLEHGLFNEADGENSSSSALKCSAQPLPPPMRKLFRLQTKSSPSSVLRIFSLSLTQSAAPNAERIITRLSRNILRQEKKLFAPPALKDLKRIR